MTVPAVGLRERQVLRNKGQPLTVSHNIPRGERMQAETRPIGIHTPLLPLTDYILSRGSRGPLPGPLPWPSIWTVIWTLCLDLLGDAVPRWALQRLLTLAPTTLPLRRGGFPSPVVTRAGWTGTEILTRE